MGNANGREEDEGSTNMNINNVQVGRIVSSESMGNSPPGSPGLSQSPLMFAPQMASSEWKLSSWYFAFGGPIQLLCSNMLPVAPLRMQRDDGTPFQKDLWQTDKPGALDQPPEKGIPTVITWSLGGNSVAVEGSWDNWTSRKTLRKSGKDHAVLLVLPSGIFHYRFIVDGETRYTPDLPHVSSEIGLVCNVLDVHDHVPENLDSVVEFEAPASPDSSYSRAFPGEDEFAKEPMIVPPQLQLTVLGMQNSDDAASSRPQHVMLNHLLIEKGWAASQSVVALGLTHRFQSKYVTVVLYKPVRR